MTQPNMLIINICVKQATINIYIFLDLFNKCILLIFNLFEHKKTCILFLYILLFENQHVVIRCLSRGYIISGRETRV
jgi:hypothetical protein